MLSVSCILLILYKMRQYHQIKKKFKNKKFAAKIDCNHILDGCTLTGITFDEAKRFLKPEPIISSIQKGSIVELISGPFKGERAKVVRIDESREEVVLELIEAAVPIPVTVKADQIRIIQKEAD